MSRPPRSLSEKRLRHLGRGMQIAVLSAGALLFFVPFLSMLSTSVKLDEEMSSEQFHLLPKPPIPRHASPYAMENPGVDLERRRTWTGPIGKLWPPVWSKWHRPQSAIGGIASRSFDRPSPMWTATKPCKR